VRGFCAVANPQFCIDIRGVKSHRAQANIQCLGNFFVRTTFGQIFQHFVFAFCQGVSRWRGLLYCLHQNLRGRGNESVIFRTRVSMLWFRVLREQIGDLDGLVDALKRQRREMVRSGTIDDGVAAMDFARFAPARIYAKMARRTFGGELCSFFFAFTGEFLAGQQSFLGAPILNGFHVAPVPVSPGSAAVMSLRDGRLNVTHVQQRGLLSESEQALFRDRLFADLLGES